MKNIAINYCNLILQGRVTADPTVANVGNGGRVAINFSIAYNLTKEKVYFIPCTLFTDNQKRIEHFTKNIRKGVYLLVQGDLFCNKFKEVEQVKVNVREYRVGSYPDNSNEEPFIPDNQPMDSQMETGFNANKVNENSKPTATSNTKLPDCNMFDAFDASFVNDDTEF